MSTDKRSVATDALATLGTIIGPGEKRDAIHLAVEPVEAGHILRPGDHITVRNGIAELSEVGMGLGIVDPFLRGIIRKGERFWFVMYPRQVHSLRHVWTHPAFPDEGEKPEPTRATATACTNNVREKAEARIREMVDRLGPDGYDGEIPLTYERIMEAAGAWLVCEDRLTQQGSQSWQDTFPGMAEEFWALYQAVTGADVPEEKRRSFFSCSC